MVVSKQYRLWGLFTTCVRLHHTHIRSGCPPHPTIRRKKSLRQKNRACSMLHLHPKLPCYPPATTANSIYTAASCKTRATHVVTPRATETLLKGAWTNRLSTRIWHPLFWQCTNRIEAFIKQAISPITSTMDLTGNNVNVRLDIHSSPQFHPLTLKINCKQSLKYIFGQAAHPCIVLVCKIREKLTEIPV